MHSFGSLHFNDAGAFQSELLSLVITFGTGEVFRGQGFLSWTRKNGPRIEAITDGGQALSDRFFAAGGRLRDDGQLMSDAQFATLEAHARDGNRIHIARVDPQQYDVRIDNPFVVWRFNRRSILSSISLTASRGSSTLQYLEILASGAVTFDWPRRSPANQSCFEFSCDLGRVSGMKMDLGLWKITLEPKEACETERAVTAIIIALSFWTGSIVQVVAYESRKGEVIRRVLRSTDRPLSRPIAPPLGHRIWRELIETHEFLLAKAINFFYAPQHDEIASSLFAFYSSDVATFTSHALISCAVLEGLAQRMAGASQLDVISEEQKRQIDTFLQGSGFREELVNRIRGFVGILNTPTGANTIASWAKTGFLGIAEEERLAWKTLRNAAAHGKLSLFDGAFEERQQRVHERNCVYNLINKLVLHAIGYNGRYFDYKNSRIQDFCGASAALAEGASGAEVD